MKQQQAIKPASEHPVLEITRVFDATPAHVFEAWLDREEWQSWIGPEGIDCEVPLLERRVGGRYRVIMHLPDEVTPQELRMKGSRSGKNYIGPPGPAAGERDREIVSFDGRVMITRFMDKDANTRYGSMVYVRCAPKA